MARELRSPNMRVQRTRSSASPPRSPLTRGPLGGTKRLCLAVTLLTGCVVVGGCALGLPAYNKPFQERVRVVSASPEVFSIRVEGADQEPSAVPKDGLTVVCIPVLPRECSTYLLGIKIKDRSVEARPIIQFIRGGRVIKVLSVNALREMPSDSAGYREVRL